MKPIRVNVSWWFWQRAMVLWPFILMTPNTDKCTWKHELYHWHQILSWGILPWYIIYLSMGLFYMGKPANIHPLERKAYSIQWECEKE